MSYPLQKFILFDIDYTLFDTDNLKETGLTSFKIYDEVLDVLEKLSKVAELGIISKGESSFQETKLFKTGISKFFKGENIHIAENKEDILQETLDKYSNKKLFFVDDRIKVLQMVNQITPDTFTIWVKRGPFVEIMKDIEFEPDAVVDNLEKVVEIVENTSNN